MPDEGETVPTADAFMEFATEFADGERWKLLRADGWDDFEVRLAETVADLPVRRRQALMMLLLSMIEALVEPGDVREWLSDHDVSDSEGIEEMISWLRSRRRDGLTPER